MYGTGWTICLSYQFKHPFYSFLLSTHLKLRPETVLHWLAPRGRHVFTRLDTDNNTARAELARRKWCGSRLGWLPLLPRPFPHEISSIPAILAQLYENLEYWPIAGPELLTAGSLLTRKMFGEILLNSVKIRNCRDIYVCHSWKPIQKPVCLLRIDPQLIIFKLRKPAPDRMAGT